MCAKARKTDEILTSKFHQGPPACAGKRSPNAWLQSRPLTRRKMNAWQTGGVHAWLKGALGDAMHAVLCGAGHNLRMILRKLRLLCVFILVALLNRCIATDVMA